MGYLYEQNAKGNLKLANEDFEQLLENHSDSEGLQDALKKIHGTHLYEEKAIGNLMKSEDFEQLLQKESEQSKDLLKKTHAAALYQSWRSDLKLTQISKPEDFE